MKKLLLALWVICALSTSAQTNFTYENDKYFEVGGSVGLMNARTDLSRKILWNQGHTSASVFAAFNYQNLLVGRAEFTFGAVEASDLESRDDKLKPRGLSFKSNISEIAVIGEFHPLMLNYWTDMYGAPDLSPYIAAGVGMFWFEPKTFYNGEWLSLPKYRTEGQGFPEYPDRKPYSLQQFSFPLGIGVKYDISPSISMRAEFLYRFTSTDYLDDVSKTYVDLKLFDKYMTPAEAAIAKALSKRITNPNTTAGEPRGFSKDKDGFFVIGLKLSVSLGRTYDYW